MGSKQIRNKFTEEQMDALRRNPFVFNVTESRLMLSKKFKELFMDAYADGQSPRDILEKHGFTEDLIGVRRFDSIPKHIFDEYETYGEFHEGYSHPQPLYRKSKAPKGSTDNVKAPKSAQRRTNLPKRFSRDTYHAPSPEQEELKELHHKVDYLTQEVEFLKKITSIKTTKK